MNLQKLVNAIACAVAVLEGTDGGYSPKEKMEAKLILMEIMPILTKTVTYTLGDVNN